MGRRFRRSCPVHGADGWTLLTAGLPLRSVTTLACAAGSLLAGGVGGIARSLHGGLSWQRCSVPGSVER